MVSMSKMLPDRHKRAGQRLIVRSTVDVTNELAINLDDIEKEILEIAKGGVACTEIIQRKGDAFTSANPP